MLLYNTVDEAQEDAIMNRDVMWCYIAYASANFQPTLVDSASPALHLGLSGHEVWRWQWTVHGRPASVWDPVLPLILTLQVLAHAESGYQLLWTSGMWRRSGVCTVKPSSRLTPTQLYAALTLPF